MIASLRAIATEDETAGGTHNSKWVADGLFAAGVVVGVLSWLTPVLAALIRLDSPGPVFFKQLRTGQHGRPFYCYKFRSMRLNADADAAQARRGDGRITPLGR